MIKSIKGKLHNSKGFTMGEMLLSVLILLMVSLVMATGMPAVKSAYEKVVLISNSEVLLSTTVSALRNELGAASAVEKVTGSTTDLTYYSTLRKSTSKIGIAATTESSNKPTVVLYRYSGEYVKESSPEAIALSSGATVYDKDLYVTYSSVDFTDGVVTFTGLSVDHVSGTTGLAKMPSLKIRVISSTKG